MLMYEDNLKLRIDVKLHWLINNLVELSVVSFGELII